MQGKNAAMLKNFKEEGNARRASLCFTSQGVMIQVLIDIHNTFEVKNWCQPKDWLLSLLETVKGKQPLPSE